MRVRIHRSRNDRCQLCSRYIYLQGERIKGMVLSWQIERSQSQQMYRDMARVRYSLAVQHAEGLGRHAVDAPIGVPVLVAYRDREPAVVRPYQVNQLPLAALDLQRLALAGVCGVVPLCEQKTRNTRYSHSRCQFPTDVAVIRGTP